MNDDSPGLEFEDRRGVVAKVEADRMLCDVSDCDPAAHRASPSC